MFSNFNYWLLSLLVLLTMAAAFLVATDRNHWVLPLLVMLTTGVVATAFLTDAPIQKGYVYAKNFYPASLAFSPELSFMIPERWSVNISSCSSDIPDITSTLQCKKATYRIPQEMYNTVLVNDFVHLSMTKSWLRSLSCFVFGVMSLCCTYFVFWIIDDMIVDDGTLSLWVLLLLTGANFLLVVGEACVFLGIKGPEGYF